MTRWALPTLGGHLGDLSVKDDGVEAAVVGVAEAELLDEASLTKKM